MKLNTIKMKNGGIIAKMLNPIKESGIIRIFNGIENRPMSAYNRIYFVQKKGFNVNKTIQTIQKSAIMIALLSSLTACTPKLVEQLPYYKLAVIQGMPLDAKAVLSLQSGMTRQQVQLAIGEPLLRPSFRDSQWDYNYEVMRGGKVKESRSLTVYFNGNVVSRVEGSALDYAREQLNKPAHRVQ